MVIVINIIILNIDVWVLEVLEIVVIEVVVNLDLFKKIVVVFEDIIVIRELINIMDII